MLPAKMRGRARGNNVRIELHRVSGQYRYICGHPDKARERIIDFDLRHRCRPRPEIIRENDRVSSAISGSHFLNWPACRREAEAIAEEPAATGKIGPVELPLV